MKRTIVQITFDTFGDITDGNGQVESRLHILDDHGDVFELVRENKKFEWHQMELPDLPDKGSK